MLYRSVSVCQLGRIVSVCSWQLWGKLAEALPPPESIVIYNWFCVFICWHYKANTHWLHSHKDRSCWKAKVGRGPITISDCSTTSMIFLSFYSLLFVVSVLILIWSSEEGSGSTWTRGTVNARLPEQKRTENQPEKRVPKLQRLFFVSTLLFWWFLQVRGFKCPWIRSCSSILYSLGFLSHCWSWWSWSKMILETIIFGCGEAGGRSSVLQPRSLLISAAAAAATAWPVSEEGDRRISIGNGELEDILEPQRIP